MLEILVGFLSIVFVIGFPLFLGYFVMETIDKKSNSDYDEIMDFDDYFIFGCIIICATGFALFFFHFTGILVLSLF